MSGAERRRSARHLLGLTAEVHVGPDTVMAVVHDVSRHGMGLILPGDVAVKPGDLLWILATSVASYAITATVRRVTAEGVVGVELEEVLTGDALDVLESLPIAEAVASESMDLATGDAGDPSTTEDMGEVGEDTDAIKDPSLVDTTEELPSLDDGGEASRETQQIRIRKT